MFYSESNIHKYIFYSFFTLFCICFILLGFFTIATSDDFWHAHIILNIRPALLAPFAWSYAHYFKWTGRVFVSFTQGVFTVIPTYTNLIATLNAFLFLTIIVFHNENQLKKINLTQLKKFEIHAVLLLLIFYISYYVLGESLFWVAGVYLWPLIIFVVSSFLFDLLSEMEFTPVENLLLVFICILLGNSLELMFFPGILLIGNLFFKVRKNKIPLNFLLLLALAFISGVLLSILSPGNSLHLNYGRHELNLNLKSQWIHVQHVFLKIFDFFRWNFFVAFSLAFGAIFPLNISKKLTIEKCLFNLLVAVTSLLPLVPLYGFNADRTYIYFCIFFSYSLFWFVQYLKIRWSFFKVNTAISQSFLMSGLAIACIILIVNIQDARMLRLNFLEQQQQIQKQSLLTKNVVVKKISTPMRNHLLFYNDLTNDPKIWANLAQAKYYGLYSLIAY